MPWINLPPLTIRPPDPPPEDQPEGYFTLVWTYQGKNGLLTTDRVTNCTFWEAHEIRFTHHLRGVSPENEIQIARQKEYAP